MELCTYHKNGKDHTASCIMAVNIYAHMGGGKYQLVKTEPMSGGALIKLKLDQPRNVSSLANIYMPAYDKKANARLARGR